MTDSPMATMMQNTVMPRAGRALIRDPELLAVVNGLLAPLKGAKLEVARAAVVEVRDGGGSGTFREWADRYAAAIARAAK